MTTQDATSDDRPFYPRNCAEADSWALVEYMRGASPAFRELLDARSRPWGSRNSQTTDTPEGA